MLPSFEKRPYLFSKRDTNPNWRELSAVKNVINVTDVECSVTERERAKNTKSRLHSRSSHRHDSLPTIKETSAPDLTRTSTPSTAAVSDEGGQLLGSKNEKVRLCIKRWRKMGLSRSNASTFHFEVSIHQTGYNRKDKVLNNFIPSYSFNKLFPCPKINCYGSCLIQRLGERLGVSVCHLEVIRKLSLSLSRQ